MEILKNFETNVEQYVGAVKTRFISVAGAQTDLDNKVADNQSDIDTLDASFKSYVDDHDGVHYQLGRDAQNVDASIADIKSTLGELDQKIYDKVEEQAESATGEFTAVRSEFQAADASIRADMAQMDSDLRSYVGSQTGMQFSALISRINSSFQATHADISTLESNVNTWQSNHENEYQALVDKDSQIDASLYALNSWITNHETEYQALVAADASIRAELNKSFGEQFSALIGRINSSFQATYADISTLESNVSDWQSNHETEYQALVAADASIREDMTQMDDDLRQYARTQTGMQFSALIGRINSSFQEVHADISTLESDVNDWQTDHESEYQTLVDSIGTTADTSVDNTVYGKIAEILQIIEDNELVCAQAITNLNARLTAAGI